MRRLFSRSQPSTPTLTPQAIQQLGHELTLTSSCPARHAHSSRPQFWKRFSHTRRSSRPCHARSKRFFSRQSAATIRAFAERQMPAERVDDVFEKQLLPAIDKAICIATTSFS